MDKISSREVMDKVPYHFRWKKILWHANAKLHARRKWACTVALGPHINYRTERAIKAQFNEKILGYNLKPYIGDQYKGVDP
jgi:hypothetical protein